MFSLANPAGFTKVATALAPWLQAASAVLLGAGLYLALFGSPRDYQQGETVRIMYVHVHAAWLALFGYTSMAGASAVGLIWKHPLAHLYARAASPVGAAFTFICLVSGALWGKPMWGTWWVWDARLTSMLILLFLYLGHMALNNAFDYHQRGQNSAAVLALVGAVNIPIIKFSVDWWNTLHQPASVVKAGGPSIDATMLAPLLLMATGFTALFVAIVFVRMRAELVLAKVQTIRHLQASLADAR